MHQINVSYTLNLHDVVCQLCFNKAEQIVNNFKKFTEVSLDAELFKSGANWGPVLLLHLCEWIAQGLVHVKSFKKILFEGSWHTMIH